MRNWFAFFAAGAILLGCGSPTSPGLRNLGAGGQAGSGGAGGNVGAPGCTKDPDCQACEGCYALCICTTGSSQNECKQACGLPTGSGGSGSGGSSAGGSGAGGSGSGGTSSTGGSSGSGGSVGSGGSSAGGSSSGGSGGQTSTKGALAGGISISQININQGVSIAIEKNGQAVGNRNAPVVQGREALLRVFVSPAGGFSSRTIVGRLSVSGAKDQTVSRSVSGASSQSNLGSTFNFTVPAAQMTGTTKFSVRLEEASGSTKGTVNGATYPGSGTANMSAESPHGAFKVMVVPVVMNGYTPQVPKTTLVNTLMSVYPASAINMTVHAAVNYPNGSVSANGSGWDTALQWVSQLRNQLGVDSKTFIYGALAPANSMQSFCGGGCVAGLGSVPPANYASGRAAVGLGYFPDGSGGPSNYSGGAPFTMAHELGHALGRNHAPCSQGGSISGVDPSFPYSGGTIGVWGYDLNTKQLKSPSQFKDFMGYCNPNWISDYTYSGIFTRESYVNANGYIIPSSDPLRAPGRFRIAIIEPDGTMHWMNTVDMTEPVWGQERQVQVRDKTGNVVGTVVGFFQPLADLAGGTLYVRESSVSVESGVHAIAVPGLSPTVLGM